MNTIYLPAIEIGQTVVFESRSTQYVGTARKLFIDPWDGAPIVRVAVPYEHGDSLKDVRASQLVHVRDAAKICRYISCACRVIDRNDCVNSR